jgi:hypothetical protein
MSGEARCSACQHVEVVVAPVGTSWMECSKCHAMKSLFTHPALRNEDLYTCRCGCDVFRMTKADTYCVNCGISHGF